ncbi:hypothetical protein E4U55_001131 [Claviceps digitariae]|nr:hypothetical protein E4U55_001131 [Claviceps digitariae]
MRESRKKVLGSARSGRVSVWSAWGGTVNGVDVGYEYETRGSLRRWLSRMDVIDANNGSGSRPALYPARAGSADGANDKCSSGTDESSNGDSIGSLTSINSLSSPAGQSPSVPSSSPNAGSPSSSSSSEEAASQTALSPSKFSSASSPLDEASSDDPSSYAPSSDEPCPSLTKRKTVRKTSSKTSGTNKNDDDEASFGSDNILGPFANDLQSSTRQKLLREANALRDESGKVCPLQMARLFWANSTLRASPWPELDRGIKSIRKMRKESFNWEDIKARREREDAVKKEKEATRFATKRKYGLIGD